MNENILNLLYCLDSKYDIQALISINSFLKNYDKDLNLHFIHENSNSLKKYKEKILINKKVKDINFYDFNPHEKKIIDNYIKNNSLRKVASTEDITRLTNFLNSNQAKHINGQLIRVDGCHL